MPRNSNAMFLFDLKPLQIQELVRKLRRRERRLRTCRLTNLPTTARGYPKSLRLTQQDIHGSAIAEHYKSGHSYVAAQIVLIASGRYPNNPDDQASHLCANPRCVNPEHLVWETPAANYDRKKCRTRATCPNCVHTFNPCEHEPQCLNVE